VLEAEMILLEESGGAGGQFEGQDGRLLV